MNKATYEEIRGLMPYKSRCLLDTMRNAAKSSLSVSLVNLRDRELVEIKCNDSLSDNTYVYFGELVNMVSDASEGALWPLCNVVDTIDLIYPKCAHTVNNVADMDVIMDRVYLLLRTLR